MHMLKKILISIFILWLVATINFFLIHLPSAGGTLENLQVYAPERVRRMIQESYGYFDVLIVSYLKYLRSMFTFGIIPPYFGWSAMHHEFVAEGLARRLPITLMLLGSGLAGSMILGIVIGVFVASRRGTKMESLVVYSALTSWSIPPFVLQVVAIFFVGKILGRQTAFVIPPFVAHDLGWWLEIYRQLTLPILTLVLTGVGYWLMMTRNLALEALTQQFMVTARAKGLSDRKMLFKHAFKSIQPQIATMVALSLPSLVTGSFITEFIFGIPGVAYYYIESFMVNSMIVTIVDAAVAEAVFFLFAFLLILFNLITDLIYCLLDPRIRVGARPGHK